jgi:hypothetical protein
MQIIYICGNSLYQNLIQQCHIQELNPSFLFDLHQNMVTNEYQYVTKMTLSASMGGLWGDFTTIFWKTKYL